MTGASTWQGAWLLGFHDERLGWGNICEIAEVMDLHKQIQATCMGFEEKSWGQGSRWGLSGCGQAHLPGSFQILLSLLSSLKQAVSFTED